MEDRILEIWIVFTAMAVIVAISIVIKENNKPHIKESIYSESTFNIRTDFSKNQIPEFQFTNQYSEVVTQHTFKDKIYVADFFFTRCPTICPLMSGNKFRIQQAFKNNDDILLLSHSIDVAGDSIPILLEYANRVGAIKDKWHLVTGDYDAIYDIAKEYYVTAQEDDLNDGSFIHDGSFILIGRDRTIKGIYDGTDRVSTTKLIAHIKSILK